MTVEKPLVDCRCEHYYCQRVPGQPDQRYMYEFGRFAILMSHIIKPEDAIKLYRITPVLMGEAIGRCRQNKK